MDYEKKYKEAQKWIESIYSELSHEQQMEAEAFFPELEESKDERIRKEILHFIKKRDRSGCDYDYDKWIAWLEKQGKKETLCDKCRKEHPSHSCQDITALGRCALENQDEQKKSYDVCDSSMMDNKKSPYGEKRDFGYFEEKPADKVEPKFKVGNWYQCTKDFFGKGVTFDKNTAYYCAKEGCLLDGCHIAIVKDLYDNFKLWTIQDAKDGDVLHSPSHHIIWIYKDNEHCYACVNMNYVTENTATNNQIFIPNDACPATKDEQTILFANMEEAGYMWDADKRVLKKIEQKPAENKGMNLVEEDMTPFQKKVFCIIDTAIEEEQGLKQVCEELLRLAHDEIMQKPAWSEEDEDAIGMAIIALEDMYDEDAPNTTYGGYNLPFNKAAERLKSIKERYTWKPSDEQMRALHDLNLTGNISYVGQGQVLIELYNDLKKLTE